MNCFEHRLLLQDERTACEDVRRMRESQPENHVEISRLQDIADIISERLREHLATCLECNSLSRK